MEDYYKILGLNSSATRDEIRRAYRILARRYHPDVNPGDKSAEKFKDIAAAYKVLSDEAKKRSYDSELNASINSGSYRDKQNQKFRAQSRFFEAQRKANAKMQTRAKPKKQTPNKVVKNEMVDSASKIARGAKSFFDELIKSKKQKKTKPAKKKKIAKASKKTSQLKVSIIEASVSVLDAIVGIKKTIEIVEPEGTRKVSIKIPPGSRPGKVIRMRSKSDAPEELVVILRIAPHPNLSLESRGLVVDLPVSLEEATFGATIKAPGIDEEHMVSIPQGTQSGDEIRVKSKGIRLNENEREDLFYRALIQVPKSISAVGLKDKIAELQEYYAESPRKTLPTTITAM